MTDLEALRFMEGRWRAANRDVLEEAWLPAAGGTMLGAFRLLSSDAVMTIGPEDGALVYRMRHFDRDLTPWEDRDRPFALPLAVLGNGEVAFEGPNPKGETVRFIYERRGDDGLLGAVERAGERHESRYRRAARASL